ncbi:tail protein X [Candidatus Tokpelaia sp.]|uniref:tail protein X n=1 Tax=Candidatus Tokpelaia sp. TaxID=2233777 RepID=UPI00123B577C|nr:tail protein X [Candidatus Tokpelaia sp.]KAA6404497.1 hypothetical protein DPQ22_09710 [Candidatus Tokpelaia sp.]
MDYITHRTTEGERWDILALRYYRDVSRQNVLISANRALFAGFAVPARLPAGLTLQVPLIDVPVASTDDRLPPWKR